MRLAKRLEGVAPSATLTLAQKAKELQAQGRDVVSLTAGEPDFDTPPHIVRALVEALERGETRYSAVAGITELRQALRDIYQRRGRSFGADDVVVSTGAKQAIFNALFALLEPGDEAVILAPYWLSYADMIRLTGGREVVVETTAEAGFAPDPAAIERALSERTRAILLNSPSNPSGAVYDRTQLGQIAEVLRRHPQVVIIADEIYERFIFGGAPFTSILDVAPDLEERTLIVNGCSKTYAMTGLRLGWALGPKALIAAMVKLQGQSTSNTSTPTQYAGLAAITGDQAPVTRMVEAFDRRRQLVMRRLGEIPGVSCFDPRGAFYVLPDVSAHLGQRTPAGQRLEDSAALSAYLLDEHGLAVVPGTPFGAPRHIRLSFATDEATLENGLDRLRDGLARLGR